MDDSTIDNAALVEIARQTFTQAYAPYSNFRVGAALLLRDGRIFRGVNVENASFGLTNCAERTAIFSAVTDGMLLGDPVAVAVVADTPTPTTPCGACRQVLAEFNPAMHITLANLSEILVETSLAILLPGAFDARQLASGIG